MSLLSDVIIIFSLALIVILFFSRYKIPSIIGFVFTGIIAGPYALKLVENYHDIEVLSEFGIILLLFTIGMEFSIKKLFKIGKMVFLGGGLQIVITSVISGIIAYMFGFSIQTSIVIGFLISMSSTAIVLKILQEKAEINTIHGKSSLGILIFQDMAIVPIMLALPFMSGDNSIDDYSFVEILLKAVLVLGALFVLIKWVVPKLLHQVALTRNRELFLISTLVLGFSAALLFYSLGMSVALGAFVAGLVISESEYSHQAFGDIIPFRDVFSSFFFVSIGMLLDLSYFFQNWYIITLISIAILLLKFIVTSGVVFVLKNPLKSSLIAGIVLSQIGEFSLILSKSAKGYGLLTNDIYQLILSIALITMVITPILIIVSKKISESIISLKILKNLSLKNIVKNDQILEPHKNHIIVVGYGINGHNVIKAAQATDIDYIVIDTNADTVKKERQKGIPIIFGDASYEPVLEKADIHNASVIVITVPDSIASFKITETARKLNPLVHIIVRTRYIRDVKDLYSLGANEVIPEEYETSVEIFSRVLRKFLVPKSEIENLIRLIRSDAYEMFRNVEIDDNNVSGLKINIPNIEISSVKIDNECNLVNKSLLDIQLRQKFGISIIAIKRKAETIINPSPELIIEENDILYLIGEVKNINAATELFISKALND